MPAKPMWLLRLPRIIEELSALNMPVVDRGIFEELFGVRRRRAIDLLHRFGGYQSGKTFLVERLALIETLKAIQQTGEFAGEQARRTRLSEHLETLRKHQAAAKIAIPVRPNVIDSRIADLPPGISLSPGRLQVEFDSPEELLGKLLSLAQSAANDFDKFCRVTEKALRPRPAQPLFREDDRAAS